MSGSGAGTASASGKKTRGKQKINMKKIENENDRLISFSKRRSGIYKKSSELNVLCGAEIAFIVFSPAGKPFSFGHPSVESVVNRFLNQNPPPNNNTHPLVEAHRQARINQISRQVNEYHKQLDAEKEKAKVLHQLTSGITTRGWWEAPIDQLNQQGLCDQYSSLEQFRNRVIGTMNEKISAEASSSHHAPMDPAQFTYPFPTNANEEVPPVLLPGNELIRAGASSSQHAPMGPAQFTYQFPTNANVELPPVLPPGNELISAGASSSQHAPMNPPQLTYQFPTNVNVELPPVLPPMNELISAGASSSQHAPMDPAQLIYQFPTNANVEVPPVLPPGNQLIGTGASSSQHAPMDPAQLTNPFPTDANVQVPPFLPPGYGQGHQQF
ncbi:hypothetical protein PTKIN_Ptkin18bG0099600 [Pterospermum kingtungense]